MTLTPFVFHSILSTPPPRLSLALRWLIASMRCEGFKFSQERNFRLSRDLRLPVCVSVSVSLCLSLCHQLSSWCATKMSGHGPTRKRRMERNSLPLPRPSPVPHPSVPLPLNSISRTFFSSHSENMSERDACLLSDTKMEFITLHRITRFLKNFSSMKFEPHVNLFPRNAFNSFSSIRRC